MSDVVSAVGAAGKIADTVGKGSGVLGRIADYWGLGRWLDRRSRSKDVDAAVERYKSLYGKDADDGVKDLLYAKYITESRRLDNLTEVFSIVRDARRGRDDAGTVPQPDWLDAFEDGASHAYDDEVRAMWAQLLAGELDRPGSFSKRTMRTLSDMSQDEANTFRAACEWGVEWCVEGKSWHPLPLQATTEQPDGFICISGNGMLKFELAELSDLNLISRSGDDLYSEWIDCNHPLLIRYKDNADTVILTLETNSKVHKQHVFGCGYTFTTTGRELSKLCEIGCSGEADSLVRIYANKTGYTITNECRYRTTQ